MSRSWSSGSSRRWRQVRAYVLEVNRRRNRGRCRLNIPGVCTGVATQVHHTRGRKITGDDPRFLVAACAPCNRHVGEPSKRKPQPRRVTKW